MFRAGIKNSDSDLPQLAVLTAPPVITAVPSLLPVNLGLADDTQAHAGDRAAARFRDFKTTFFTVAQALSPRQLASRALDGVFHAGVDLILHCPVFSPSARHDENPIRLVK